MYQEIPQTWKSSWKVAPEIRGFWPENEGKNEATVLDFFLQIGLTESMASGATRNHPFDLEKFLESGLRNSGVLAGE